MIKNLDERISHLTIDRCNSENLSCGSPGITRRIRKPRISLKPVPRNSLMTIASKTRTRSMSEGAEYFAVDIYASTETLKKKTFSILDVHKLKAECYKLDIPSRPIKLF